MVMTELSAKALQILSDPQCKMQVIVILHGRQSDRRRLAHRVVHLSNSLSPSSSENRHPPVPGGGWAQPRRQAVSCLARSMIS
jgi:hypothetical protein